MQSEASPKNLKLQTNQEIINENIVENSIKLSNAKTTLTSTINNNNKVDDDLISINPPS